MGKMFKFALIGMAAALVVIAAAVAYVAATVDPNQYKPQIVQAVKDKTSRTLRLDGDIALSLFPSLGARLGKVSLSEAGGDREFAGVDEARVALKLMPLLSRQVVVDTVEVKGLRANLVRHKDGTTNLDDLAGAGQKPDAAAKTPAPPQAGAPEIRIDIDHVLVENAAITYTDLAAGSKLSLSKVNLRTGRIANGVPSNIEFAAAVRSDKPKLDIQASLKSKVTFDFEQQHYAVAGVDLSIQGDAAGIVRLDANAKGSVDARLAAKEFVISGLAVSATGKQEGGDLRVKLDIPKLALTRDTVSGDKIVLEAALAHAKSRLDAKVEIAGAQGTAQAFKTGPINANIEMRGEGSVTKANLAGGALTGSIEGNRYELPQFTAKIDVNDPKLPKNPVDAAVSGAARIDLARQTAGVEFAAKLDDSHIDGRAGIAKFSPPAYSFEVTIDQLDVDRYLPRESGKSAASGDKAGRADGGADKSTAPAKGGGEPPIDLSGLKTLNASGSLKIGALKVKNIRSSQVRAEIKVANGRLDVNPIAANLYQGALSGALSAQAVAAPTFAVKQNLSGISVGPLLRDAADIDTLEGKGNIALDVTTQGATVAALKKALNGTAAANLSDGALKGIDIAGTIREVRAKLRELKGEQVQAANKTHKTDFTEFKASFSIKNGVARNSDLAVKSPLLRIGGEGAVDIGNDAIDYLMKATVVGTAGGQGGKDIAELKGVTIPVRFVGSLGAPQYKLDFSGVATELAKQQVQNQLLKGKDGDKLRDSLKGLFR